MADDPVVAYAPIPPKEDDQPEPSYGYGDRLIDARLAGHGWEDVDRFIGGGTTAALAEGYSQPEVDQFLGMSDPQARMLADARNRLSSDEQFAASLKSATAPVKITPLEQPSAERMAGYGDLMMPTSIALPEGDQPLAPSGINLNDPMMRSSYARSLLRDEVRSPRDFAERYAGALAGSGGLDTGLFVRAAGELAQSLPSDRDFTDQAIAIAHSSGVALTPYQPPSPEENLAANRQYMKEGAGDQFETKLAPEEETKFRQWVKDKNVPFDPDEGGPSDYDMRGFYRGLMNGDEHAHTGMNANDGQLHFSDWWKTPYHDSFSAESQWANPETAPRWNDQDQLVTPDGQVVFDERNRPADKVKVIRNNLIDHWTNTGQPLDDTYKQAQNDPELAAQLTTAKVPEPSMLERFAQADMEEVKQSADIGGWITDRVKDWYAWRMRQPDATNEGWDKHVAEAKETLRTGKLSDEAMNVALGFVGNIEGVGAKFGEAIGLLKPASRSMSDLMATAAPVSPDKTRLYRVDVAPGEQPKPPATDNPQPTEVQDALRGRWWTDNPQSAQHYLDDPQRGNTVYYVDVPKEEAELYRLSNNPGTFGARYSGAPDREFVLPESVTERYGGRSTLDYTVGQKFADAIDALKPGEPKVRILDPAAPNGIAGEMPISEALALPKPAERVPVEPVSHETPGTSTPPEPPSPLEFVPEATPAEKMQAIARDWTGGDPEVLADLRARNGGELPKVGDPDFFEKLAAGQDPATVELAKGHDASMGAWGFIKSLAGDLLSDESGALNIFRTPQQQAERAAYTDSRDFMRPLIIQQRSAGEQVMSHFYDQADHWKTVGGQVENLFKLLEPHMPEWEAELAKGINGNPMNTMIGNLIQYIEGRSMGAAMRHDSPLTPVADGIRYINENVRGMLEDGFKRGVINQNAYFEDYFRHMWKDPNKAKLAFDEFQARVGKLGSSSGLMQRSLPTFEDGLKMGLEPAIKNPLELTLFDAGQKIKYLKSAEILEFARTAIKDPTTGETFVNWRMSPKGDEVPLNSHRTTKGIPNDPMGRDLTAYANPGLANTWNDWLSKGFHERPGATSTIAQKMQYSFNTGNALALAVPAYHALAETVETMTGGISQAMSQLRGGHLLEAGKEAVLAIPAFSLPRGIIQGRKLIQEYNSRFITDPAIRQIVDAGGRFGPRQEIYKMGSATPYGTAIKRGQLVSEWRDEIKGIFGDANEPTAYRASHAPLRALGVAAHETGRLLNLFSSPLFDHMIPALKAYNNVRKMDLFLRDNPAATQVEISNRASQIVRNTDERLGEMNMDNVFWKKGIKEAAQIGMISQGWVYGWVRQLTSAAGLNIEKMAFENNPVARQSLIAFSMAYATTNMAYQYAKTGTFPWNTDTPWKDLLMPRSGGTNQWGSPERALAPSHAKELWDYYKIGAYAAHDPAQGIEELWNYAKGKGKAPVQFLMGLATGKDAIGHDIGHTADGWTGYLENSFKSIMFSSLNDRKVGTNISPMETMMGFKPLTKAAQDPKAFYEGLYKMDRKLYKQEIGRAKYENKIYINPRNIPVDPEAGGGPASSDMRRFNQLMQRR